MHIGSGWPAPAVAGRLLSPPCASAIAPTPPQAQARLRVAPTRPLVDYRSLLSCSWRSRMNCCRTQTRGASAPQTCRPIAPHPPPIARASHSVPARVYVRGWHQHLELRQLGPTATVALSPPMPRPSAGREMRPRVVKSGQPDSGRQQQHPSSKHSGPDKRHRAKTDMTLTRVIR